MNKEEISLCKSCHCMTKTINGKCGKCKAVKVDEKKIKDYQKYLDEEASKFKLTGEDLSHLTDLELMMPYWFVEGVLKPNKMLKWYNDFFKKVERITLREAWEEFHKNDQPIFEELEEKTKEKMNKEKKLKEGLFFGLFCGLVSGLFCGLVFGAVYGLVFGFFCGLVFGFFCGLVFGFFCGLVEGLISGLSVVFATQLIALFTSSTEFSRFAFIFSGFLILVIIGFVKRIIVRRSNEDE